VANGSTMRDVGSVTCNGTLRSFAPSASAIPSAVRTAASNWARRWNGNYVPLGMLTTAWSCTG
jgi:hypothetical protein